MSRRNRYAEKELDQLQKLKYENKRLKRQIAALRKQIARIDIDRYENIKDIIERHHKEDLDERLLEEKKKLETKWECHECKRGVLVRHELMRIDGAFYYRKCNNCNHRTKVKPYKDKE